MSKEGIWPSKNNIRVIAKFALPRTYTVICTFLGVPGHYRCFIKNYARIELPLIYCLKVNGSKKKENATFNKEVA